MSAAAKPSSASSSSSSVSLVDRFVRELSGEAARQSVNRLLPSGAKAGEEAVQVAIKSLLRDRSLLPADIDANARLVESTLGAQPGFVVADADKDEVSIKDKLNQAKGRKSCRRADFISAENSMSIGAFITKEANGEMSPRTRRELEANQQYASKASQLELHAALSELYPRRLVLIELKCGIKGTVKNWKGKWWHTYVDREKGEAYQQFETEAELIDALFEEAKKSLKQQARTARHIRDQKGYGFEVDITRIAVVATKAVQTANDLKWIEARVILVLATRTRRLESLSSLVSNGKRSLHAASPVVAIALLLFAAAVCVQTNRRSLESRSLSSR